MKEPGDDLFSAQASSGSVKFDRWLNLVVSFRLPTIKMSNRLEQWPTISVGPGS